MKNDLYNRTQLIQFLGKVFGSEIRLSNQGANASILCPFCSSEKDAGYSKTKLVIHTEHHILHCWVCGYKSKNLVHLLKKFHPEFLKEYSDIFNEKVGSVEENTLIDSIGSIVSNASPTDPAKDARLRLPDGFRGLFSPEGTSPYRYNIEKYLRARQVASIENLWYWKLGYATSPEWKNRVIIPSFDQEGNLNYWTGRSVFPWMRPKYKNPPVDRRKIIFNELNIDWTKELTIVEGVFDLFSANDNATCLLGSTLSNQYKLFNEIVKHKTPILLALDADAMKKTQEIAKALSEFDIKIRILEIQSGKDVGEMGRKEFLKIMNDAKIYDRNSDLKKRIGSII